MKSENVKKLIGKRLKAVRKSQGKTQEQLAESADISSKYLSRVELGMENPTIETYIKLADAMNVGTTELFEVAHEVDNPSQLRKTINSLLDSASPEKLKLSVKVLRALLH